MCDEAKMARSILRRVVGWLLLTSGFFILFSAAMWILDGEREMWFYRLVAGMAFLGIWFIGSRESNV